MSDPRARILREGRPVWHGDWRRRVSSVTKPVGVRTALISLDLMRGAPMVVIQEPAAPERLAHHERTRINTAAYIAKRRYPGPVGEVLSQELLAWADFGFRLGGDGLITRLVAEIMRPQTKE